MDPHTEPQLGLDVAGLLDNSDSDSSNDDTIDDINQQFNRDIQENGDVTMDADISPEAAGGQGRDEEMLVIKRDEDEDEDDTLCQESEVKIERDD